MEIIVGLKFNNTYTKENIKMLRCGHLMIMTNREDDNSYIEGLVINFIHYFWWSLVDLPGFFQQIISPIVKCTKGKKLETIFMLPQYDI
ncbi:hypothetical protein ACHAXA_002684 [Cyclostephanos tholiformis]|jgi:DNA topoisomerase-2|uniref:DNA topoisomerase (ATP-hydrolyzing) n=1 Tax=Cyclostephanos tholiformis TaxID=382380 RepID=A0ABD3S021_9STRA